jgi:protein dithiol:quinone oxidoreductase
MQPLRINTILWGMAVLCLAAVGIAVYTQFAFDWRPCPWCILQRIIFVAIAIVCIVTASIRGVASRAVPLVIALVLALLGVASTLWQHFVAAKSASCSLTLADKIIAALHVDDALPSVFSVTGMCADAAVSLWNVPLEFWSLGLYVVMAVLSVRLLVRLPQEARPSYLR